VSLQSFPKQKRSENESIHSQPLFPIGAAPSYPSAKQIQSFLGKSKITETELTVEHVEMLLNVLILDGEIEKVRVRTLICRSVCPLYVQVPSFGAAMWESKNRNSDSDEEEDADGAKRKNKSGKVSRKYKRRRTSRIDDESSDSDVGSSRKSKKRRKDERSDTASTDESSSEKRKKKRKLDLDSDEEDTRRKRKKKQRSESETESDDDRSSRNKALRKQEAYDFSPMDLDDSFGGAYVYRAIRQERVALGWAQAPCGGCPVFDFCKDKGPVNPSECTYYEDWLRAGTVAVE
jgi:DNA-directed RNA polymerase III subunit RPC6